MNRQNMTLYKASFLLHSERCFLKKMWKLRKIHCQSRHGSMVDILQQRHEYFFYRNFKPNLMSKKEWNSKENSIIDLELSKYLDPCTGEHLHRFAKFSSKSGKSMSFLRNAYKKGYLDNSVSWPNFEKNKNMIFWSSCQKLVGELGCMSWFEYFCDKYINKETKNDFKLDITYQAIRKKHRYKKIIILRFGNGYTQCTILLQSRYLSA